MEKLEDLREKGKKRICPRCKTRKKYRGYCYCRKCINEKVSEYQQQPKVKTRIKKYHQRPEVKARHREYMREYMRKYNQRKKSAGVEG